MIFATSVIPLSNLDLIIAASLILISGVVSLALKIGLEKKLAIASARTIIQLLLVGYILDYVFKIDNPWLIALVVMIMVGAATRESVKRPTKTFKGIHKHAFFTLLFCGIITVAVVTQVIVGVDVWYQPQYVIPLLGMVLGNMLTAISLSVDYLLDSLSTKAEEIDMELAHGATSWEAARDPVSRAVAKGMIPILNNMMVVGLVSLPGMMTGQILSGTDPIVAVKYQILVMFMLAAATSLGSIIMALLVFKNVFNSSHQMMSEKIVKN